MLYMKELKRMKKFSSSFIDKNKNKKISKIKDKKERYFSRCHPFISVCIALKDSLHLESLLIGNF